MKEILKHSTRFIALIVIQALILNQLEIGFGIQLMVYPLFIILLPFDIGLISMLFLAFLMGICIDAISNTYGLHASSLVLVAYLRPALFKIFAPREGYDILKEGNVYEMGTRWFLYVFGLILLIHHLWFFLLEIFRFNEMLYVLRKTVLSLPLSFLICLLIQTMFVTKPKER